MAKSLVILLGPHAVGKMTVGQALAQRTGMRLFHNHMSIELALKLFPFGTQEYVTLNETIRRTTFELFAKGENPGLIFTYMCAFELQSEFDYLQTVIDLFAENGAECYVVELCADFEERLLRNKSENRLLHKESKRNLEWSEAEMRASSKKYRLNSFEGEKLPFENYIKIDNTHLPPEAPARRIITHFSIEENRN